MFYTSLLLPSLCPLLWWSSGAANKLNALSCELRRACSCMRRNASICSAVGGVSFATIIACEVRTLRAMAAHPNAKMPNASTALRG